MKRITYFIIWGCLIVVLLPACMTTQTAAATTAEAKVNPTTTQAPTTSQPSATLLPTVKPTATPTPSPSPTPSGPTQTPDLMTYERYASESLSPDGKWAARIVSAYPVDEQLGVFGEQAHVLLEVINLNTSEEWVLVDEWIGYGLGMANPNVIRWTEDSNFLFVSDITVPDGCGPTFYENLRRADLRTQEITPIPFEANSVSPDGQLLISYHTNQLAIFDLNSETEKTVPLEKSETEEVWPGQIFWSPEGHSILFSLLYNQCRGENLATSLVLIDLSDLSIQTLVEKDSRHLVVRGWPEWRFALVEDLDGSSWWLNVETGDLDSETPPDYVQARAVLLAFFEALSSGDYVQASELFGGDYSAIRQMNPTIDPQDNPALWQAACEINGFQCLPAGSAILDVHPSLEKYIFTVTFVKDEGLYVRGPCCGADIAEMPPKWSFTYTVMKGESGNYGVMELPVWVP